MYILVYSSHSNRRDETHASGNVGCGAPWSENTRALLWHFYFFVIFLLLLLLRLLFPTFSESSFRSWILSLTYKSGYLGKIEISLFLACYSSPFPPLSLLRLSFYLLVSFLHVFLYFFCRASISCFPIRIVIYSFYLLCRHLTVRSLCLSK